MLQEFAGYAEENHEKARSREQIFRLTLRTATIEKLYLLRCTGISSFESKQTFRKKFSLLSSAVSGWFPIGITYSDLIFRGFP